MIVRRWMAWGLMFVATACLAAQTTCLAAQGRKSADEPDDEAAAEARSDDTGEARSDDDNAGEEPKLDNGPGEADEAETKASTPEDDAFNALYAEWKELIARLRELSLKYERTRPGEEREPIKAEYNELVKRGVELEPKFIAGAMAAYAANPKKDPKLGDFLASRVKSYVENDDFEPALPPVEVLVDKKYPNDRIYAYGGLAAFATNDYDDAEKYLKRAQTFLKTPEARSELFDLARQWFSRLDEEREKWEREQEIRAAEAQADDLPRVLLKTTKGDILIELFENEAPNTVANFINLVEKDYYNGTKFHRVIPHFMAQGGDPQGTGQGGPGYTIPDEVDEPNHRLHFRGSLSMAKTAAPDSGGSQFFICFVATSHLDGKHTVFGRVIEGLEHACYLERTQDEKGEPTHRTPDEIVEARVERKRDHEYVPETIAEK